jgi:Methylase involved in ubiquinone/menaquinone biosynthesis
MNYSIDISKEISQFGLVVGVVLVSEYNELICAAHSGEDGIESWYSVLLNKILKLKISKVHSVYITINKLSTTYSFELIELLKEVDVEEVYIGLPDPVLTSYLYDDPVITFNHLYRYPDELQRRILERNIHIFADSKQSIKHSHYYFENRISNLVKEKLTSKGYIVSKNEINVNKRESSLASLLSNRHKIEYSEVIRDVRNAISEAFNDKYATYNYSDDTRSLDLNWKETFMAFYKRSSARPMSDINILNVGVGSGHEARALFSNCTSITFADIAQDGLQKIKTQIPASKTIVTSADNLSSINDRSQDLYVSLRTYNSSFFDINKAISEAHRVLKSSAVIIVSVANGFLCSELRSIIPGLLIPGTEFVDIYRGIGTIKEMYTEFLKAGFKNIQIFPTNTEIYLSGIRA